MNSNNLNLSNYIINKNRIYSKYGNKIKYLLTFFMS